MSFASRSGWLAYGVALAVVVLDQGLKAWILGGLHLTAGAPVDVWGPLRLNLVSNEGVSFGLLQIDAPWTRWALAAFALIVALALAGFVRRTEKPLTGLAFGLIIGGAVGNLLDRVRHGAVVDFIDVQALRFPWVFNLADSAITVGITLLLAESLFAPKKAPA